MENSFKVLFPIFSSGGHLAQRSGPVSAVAVKPLFLEVIPFKSFIALKQQPYGEIL